MLNYKNIVFDFGNVLASFDETHILNQLHAAKEDLPLLKELIFKDWAALDEGTIEYRDAKRRAVAAAPNQLKETVECFFEDWYKYLPPIHDTWKLIRELKENGAQLYILSNAPTHFAKHANFYEIVTAFDGIVFSAPLVLSKPDARFYQYLFDTYHLKPEECFFIDDKEINIEAGKKLGMDGIIFTGDIDAVRRKLFS